MKKAEEFKPVTVWATTDKNDNIIMLHETRRQARWARNLLALDAELQGARVRRLVAEREGRA